MFHSRVLSILYLLLAGIAHYQLYTFVSDLTVPSLTTLTAPFVSNPWLDFLLDFPIWQRDPFLCVLSLLPLYVAYTLIGGVGSFARRIPGRFMYTMNLPGLLLRYLQPRRYQGFSRDLHISYGLTHNFPT